MTPKYQKYLEKNFHIDILNVETFEKDSQCKCSFTVWDSKGCFSVLVKKGDNIKEAIRDKFRVRYNWI